jgi:phospholipase D1/2
VLQHAISDVHPGNIDDIVFPGQDYNNARIMDFQDVSHWQNNKLDRTESSRMGWSDVSLCLSGPSVWDLKNHFVQRWNFIFDEKYQVRKDIRYTRLALDNQSAQPVGLSGGFGGQGQYYPPPPQGSGYRGAEGAGDNARGFGDGDGQRGFLDNQGGILGDRIRNRIYEGRDKLENRLGVTHQHSRPSSPGNTSQQPSIGAECQLTRSCAKWSHGVIIEVL